LKIWKNKPSLSESEKKNKKQEKILLVLSGILIGLSFPPLPFPFQLLMFVGFIPYFYVIEKKNKLLDISRSTYLMAFVFSAITIYWVGSWQASADPFLMISGILLVFVNPVFFLIPATLLYFSRKVFPSKVTLFFLPFFWVSYEYLYMITDLSFPWLTLGNGLSGFTSFIQIADIIGALGLSAVIFFINIFIYKGLMFFNNSDKKYLIHFTLALFLFVGILLYGFNRIKSFKISDDKIRVGLVQPNIDPWDKWEPPHQDLNSFLELYTSLSRDAVSKGAQLLVWPETALPVYLMSGLYNETVDSIYNFLAENNVYLLTGMPDIRYYLNKENAPDDAKYNESGDYYYTTYNAIMLFSPHRREIQRYGKTKLVPFGERVPFVDQLPFLGNLIKWGVGLSGWNIGKDTILFKMPLKENDTLKINGLVCYESIYPVLVAGFVDRGADFISVVTNDSWYGKLSGPYQHKEFAILRAVENRRSVVRAANGGVSCLINSLGIIETETEMFTKTFLVVDVPLQKEETFYSHNPLIIPIISSVFSLWILGLFILKKIKDKFKL